MTETVTSPGHSARTRLGRLGKVLLGPWMKRATVTATERVADGFCLITLEGPDLKNVVWMPGQKIQIVMGSAFTARTYTPIEWDAEDGRTRILAYAHGEGPGSAWVRGVERGSECDLFGPRNSVDVHQIREPLALLGDETSIGLAYALAHQDCGRAVSYGFEVGDVEISRQVVARLGLDAAVLFGRTEDGTHLAGIEAILPALDAKGAIFVLTGKAQTIQRLRKALKQRDIPADRIATKAYWAPGKAGLD